MMQHWQPRERLETALDACIDQLNVLPTERLLLHYPQSAPALRPLLQVAVSMHALSHAQLSPTARQAGRERLRRAVLAQRRRAERPHWPAALWIVALLLMIATGVSGVTAAAANALPGDRLYGWKRASEELWLRAQPSPARAAMVALGYIDRRVGETEAVFRRAGRLDSTIVVAISEAYAQALELIAAAPPADQAGLLDTLHAGSAQYAIDLAALAETATGEDRAMLAAAVAVTQWARTAQPSDSRRVPQPVLPWQSRDPTPPTTPTIPPATPPGQGPGNDSRPPRHDSQAPDNDSRLLRHDSQAPGNAPIAPPGQSNKLSKPPGQNQRDRSARATPTPALVRDPSPARERGSSESAPGRSENLPPGQERKAEPGHQRRREDPGNGGAGRIRP